MESGNFLRFTDKKVDKKEIDPKQFKGIFSDGIPKVNETEIHERKVQKKNIEAKDLNRLESIDIKDMHWEEVKGSAKFSDLQGKGSVFPARSAGETNEGGTGIFGKNKPSIFDPNVLDNLKFDDASEESLKANKARKQTIEREAKEKDEAHRDEWEVVAPVKNTKTSRPKGFTQNRSAFEPAPLPKVKINAVDAIIAQNKISAESGKKAAEMKMDLDKILAEKMKERLSGGWEDEADKNIKENNEKEYTPIKEKISFAPDEIKMKKTKFANLNGLFPSLIPDIKDSNLKKDSNKIKEKRKNRSEDRSWEKV